MNTAPAPRPNSEAARLLRALFAGWVMGAVIVVHCLAVSSIVFSGDLLPFAARGAGMMLFGGAAFCLIVGLASSYRGMLAVPQEVPATVLGSVGGAIAAGTAGGAGEAGFVTMAGLLVLTGMVTGILFLAIGRFRLANLFRFIPYPVAGGFFAGTGGVLSLASISVMNGGAVEGADYLRILDADILWKWGPGAAYGLVLLLIMRRWNSPLVMMGSLVVAGALYHWGLFVLGISPEEARTLGLLLSGAPRESLWPPFGLGEFGSLDWQVLAEQAPIVPVAALVTLVCLLVYANGAALATGSTIDLDREFGAAGAAAIVAGAGGSAPGCQSFVFTLPCRMLGADTRWTGVSAALVVALTLFVSGDMLQLLPMPVVGGLLFFVGIDLLDVWLIRVRRKLPRTDYAIVLLIFVATGFLGFLEGIAVGMAATLTLFAIRLSRVDTIAEAFTAQQRHSKRIRSVPDRALLYENGERILVYRLRGHLFFGSAHSLVERLRRPLIETPPPVCIVLDFAAVTGCDFSAVNELCGFVRSAESAGSAVTVTAASPQLRASLSNNLPVAASGGPAFEPDLERGLERCEEKVLAIAAREMSEGTGRARGNLLDGVADKLDRHLREQAFFEELLDRLAPWLEPRTYPEGAPLARAGEAGEGLQFLVSGRAAAVDPRGERLFEYGPGDAVEPLAAFGDRNASSAFAAVPCRTALLTPTARRLLETEDQDLSLALYRYLVGRPALRDMRH